MECLMGYRQSTIPQRSMKIKLLHNYLHMKNTFSICLLIVSHSVCMGQKYIVTKEEDSIVRSIETKYNLWKKDSINLRKSNHKFKCVPQDLSGNVQYLYKDTQLQYIKTNVKSKEEYNYQEFFLENGSLKYYISQVKVVVIAPKTKDKKIILKIHRYYFRSQQLILCLHKEAEGTPANVEAKLNVTEEVIVKGNKEMLLRTIDELIPKDKPNAIQKYYCD